MNYDLIIIGGGPAGYLAAERAREAGLAVILAEKEHLGGVCLNEGCIPTKAFLYAGKLYEYARHKGERLGVHCQNIAYCHREAAAYKQNVVNMLVGGIDSALRRKGIPVVQGEAALGKKGDVYTVTVNGQIYYGTNILLATGSVPVIPPIPGLKERIGRGDILTSREALKLNEIPEKMVIIGAGVIGLEMASYFNMAGSRVTIIEMLPCIGGAIDGDAEKILKKQMETQGIRFCMESQVIEINDKSVCYIQEGIEKTEKFDKLLVCVGRRANADIPGIEKLGVLVEHGAVSANEKCETNVEGIYAAGDVNGKYMLAHAAYREAEAAVNNAAGREDAVDYSAVPAVIYSFPQEAAFCGMTEEEAKERGIDYTVKKASVNMSGRHVAEEGISTGMCKIIVDKKKDTIIGASIVSDYASEIIYAFVLMIQGELPLELLRRTIFPHPTVCEVIREALFS